MDKIRRNDDLSFGGPSRPAENICFFHGQRALRPRFLGTDPVAPMVFPIAKVETTGLMERKWRLCSRVQCSFGTYPVHFYMLIYIRLLGAIRLTGEGQNLGFIHLCDKCSHRVRRAPVVASARARKENRPRCSGISPPS